MFRYDIRAYRPINTSSVHFVISPSALFMMQKVLILLNLLDGEEILQV